MKDLNRLNYFMVGMPIALITGGWLIESDMLFMGMLFTIVTGAFQVITGIGVLIDSGYKHPLIKIYLAITASFFILRIFTNWKWIVVMPPALALYMSAILHIESQKRTL